MNLLVVTEMSIPAVDRTIPMWDSLRDEGCTVRFVHPRRHYRSAYSVVPDAIIAMGVSVMDRTYEVIDRFPNSPLFCYNWDVYQWVWDNPRPGEYDYKRYGELLNRATEIWVPSACTGKRTQQWYSHLPQWKGDNIHVVLSSVPYWDYDKVEDRGFAYCSLREIPDPQWDWFEKACKELKIPYLMTKHEQPYEDYQRVLAGCRLLVSHCNELSTGGLSLLEGYYLGKPCLLCNSEWHGGRDYLGDRASYFGNKYEYFLMALESNFHTPRHIKKDHKEWVMANYSEKAMCLRILERLRCHLK